MRSTRIAVIATASVLGMALAAGPAHAQSLSLSHIPAGATHVEGNDFPLPGSGPEFFYDGATFLPTDPRFWDPAVPGVRIVSPYGDRGVTCATLRLSPPMCWQRVGDRTIQLYPVAVPVPGGTVFVGA